MYPKVFEAQAPDETGEIRSFRLPVSEYEETAIQDGRATFKRYASAQGDRWEIIDIASPPPKSKLMETFKRSSKGK
jgi:hypothetical protein